MNSTSFRFSIAPCVLLLTTGCGSLLCAVDPSMYDSKTQVYDDEAQGMVDLSVVAADGVLGWPPEKEKEYYAEMDKFGPDIIPILITRYHSIKPHSFTDMFQRLIILTIGDAVVRYNGNTTRPLGAERREEALKFLASLLAPGQSHGVSGFAIIALQRCAAKVNITEPFVVEAICEVLEVGDVDPPAYDYALQVISVIGHGEATAKRVEKGVNHVVVDHPTGGIGQDETLRLARQTVQTIRQRGGTPQGQ